MTLPPVSTSAPPESPGSRAAARMRTWRRMAAPAVEVEALGVHLVLDPGGDDGQLVLAPGMAVHGPLVAGVGVAHRQGGAAEPWHPQDGQVPVGVEHHRRGRSRRPSVRSTLGRSTPATTWALVTMMSAAGEKPLPLRMRPHAVPNTFTVESATRSRTPAGRATSPGGGPAEGDGPRRENTWGKLTSETCRRRSCRACGAGRAEAVDVAGDRGVPDRLRQHARHLGQDGDEQPHHDQATEAADHAAGGPVGRPQPGAGRDELADAVAGHRPQAGAGGADDQEQPEGHEQPGLGLPALVLVEDDRRQAGGGVDAGAQPHPGQHAGQEAHAVAADGGRDDGGDDEEVEDVQATDLPITAGMGRSYPNEPACGRRPLTLSPPTTGATSGEQHRAGQRPADPRLAGLSHRRGRSRPGERRPGPGRRPLRARAPAPTRPSSDATAGSEWGGKGVTGPVEAVNGEIADVLTGWEALDQRGVDAQLIDPRRHRQQGPPGRQRRPRRLPRRRPGRGRRARPAPLPPRRRHQRPRAAHAHAQRPQRRRPRPQQPRRAGVHAGAGRRRLLRRGPALGRRDLPRPGRAPR